MNALQALKLLNTMPLEEFLNIPEENIIYEVPDNNHELVYLFTDTNQADTDIDDIDDIDDSEESPVINASTAIASLEIVRAFLLQQDNAEKYITSLQNIEKFVEARKANLMRQTNIGTYFS